MNTLPDEIVRKIADMKIAADYCSLTVYDCWGVLFWVSRCVMAEPWFCRVVFPDNETQIFTRFHGLRDNTVKDDMIVKWSQILIIRTKTALERLITNVFIERAGYANYTNYPLATVNYYFSQADSGVPPSYMARSLLRPWKNYTTQQNVAPDAIGGNGQIHDDKIRKDGMTEEEVTEIRVKLIMEVIKDLVGTM
jgi:hypothetical protein